MIKGSFNLMAFKNAFTETRKSQAGEDVVCVTIPLKINHLTIDEKGGIWVRFVAWLNEKLKRGTHIINQDPGKEESERLKAEKKFPTTLGNLDANAENAAPAANVTDQGEMPTAATGEKGGLPF